MNRRRSILLWALIANLPGLLADRQALWVAAQTAHTTTAKDKMPLESWLEQLKAPSAQQRAEAALELRRAAYDIELLRPEQAEPLLVALANALADPSPSVRCDAAHALCIVGFGDDKVVAALRHASSSTDSRARIAAQLALWRMTKDESSYSRAVEALKDDSASVRREAADALGTYAPNERTVRALVPALADKDREVREFARHSLESVCWKIHGAARAAVPALTEAFASDDPLIRSWAARALAGIGPDSRTAIPALLKALQGEDEELRHKSAWALGKISSDGKTVVPALAAALKDSSRSVRFEAAFALGTIGAGAKSAISFLQTATQGPELTVRVVSGLALWRITGEDRFARLAMNEAEQGKSVAALDAFTFLACVGAPALPKLFEGLRHPQANIHELAAYHLSEVGASAAQAVPDLIEALKDSDHKVRDMAAVALGAIGPPAAAAVPALTKAVADPNPKVRDSASTALKAIDSESIKNRVPRR
jgi:HEAT repeat protein